MILLIARVFVFSGKCLRARCTEARDAYIFRSFNNLDACVHTLVAGLGQAEQVVWTGGSAGGLATYLNADHVSSRLTGVNVVALADGGFFLDHLTMGGVPCVTSITKFTQFDCV